MPKATFKLFLLFFFFSAPLFVSAQITQVGFTTEPQTVNPGDISGTITIQLQDSSGSPAQATETFDLEFLSSSAPGEFLSPSSENPVTKTVATGSANKNFRYRDTVPGIHTLTITARGRTSGLTVTGTQTITIGNSSSPTSFTATTTHSETTSNTSVHYSSNSLSLKKIEKTYAISAGRDRIGSIGSPMQFKAETDLVYNKNAELRWNLGDGSEDYGETIVHTYDYPGDYVVVLSLSTPEGRAVARVNVKIVDPQLKVISANADRIEIRNTSKQEVSLFGWVLWVRGKSFHFPLDTIMKPGQSLSFSSKVTGLKPLNTQEVQLFAVGQTEQPQISAKIESLKQEKVAELQYKILALQEELGSMTAKPATRKVTSVATTSLKLDKKEENLAAAAGGNLEAVLLESDSWLASIKKFFLRKP